MDVFANCCTPAAAFPYPGLRPFAILIASCYPCITYHGKRVMYFIAIFRTFQCSGAGNIIFSGHPGEKPLNSAVGGEICRMESTQDILCRIRQDQEHPTQDGIIRWESP